MQMTIISIRNILALCTSPLTRSTRFSPANPAARSKTRPPQGADLDLILDAGLRAPDRGQLRPWRFVLICGKARAALGDCLASAARDRLAQPAL